jgi:mono/diheme cytochrome c family protein
MFTTLPRRARWLTGVALLLCRAYAAALPGASAPPAAAAARDPSFGQHLFAANCARCHGADARGTADAPDLLRRVRGTSRRRKSRADAAMSAA